MKRVAKLLKGKDFYVEVSQLMRQMDQWNTLAVDTRKAQIRPLNQSQNFFPDYQSQFMRTYILFRTC